MLRILLLAFLVSCYSPTTTALVQGRVSCFENKAEITGNLDISVNYNYVEDVKSLPASFGKLNLQGTKVWYIEGSATGGEVTIAAERKLYTNKAKTVQIFIRYYSTSPRRPSIYPIKGSPSLMTLPVSTSDWTEVKYDVDPSGPLVEISLYLSQGQFILFDTIVISVDSALPKSPATACQDVPNLSAPPGRSSSGGGSPSPTAIPTVRVSGATGASSSTVSRGTLSPITPAITRTTSYGGECTVVPPTECKCNCNCNCAKC